MVNENRNENRNVVYIYQSPYGTTYVVNYSGKPDVNTFLWHFDIWRSNGKHMLCSDGNHVKILFECSKSFYNLAQTEDFQRAFKHMGVTVTTDGKDILSID